MKLLTCYTPSHKVFLPQFFDSLDQTDLDVVIRMHPQECPTGEFASEGWNTTTQRKFEFLLEEMNKADYNDIMIFSDIDIQFFQSPVPFAERVLKDTDIAFQNDYYGHACTGFFYFRNTELIADFIQHAIKEIPNWRDDQEAVNKILQGDSSLDYMLLPKEYFTFGSFYKHWEGEQMFPIPDNIIMHHANWVKGIDKKLELLRVVRNQHNQKQVKVTV
jgi:hypothetical protein